VIKILEITDTMMVIMTMAKIEVRNMDYQKRILPMLNVVVKKTRIPMTKITAIRLRSKINSPIVMPIKKCWMMKRSEKAINQARDQTMIPTQMTHQALEMILKITAVLNLEKAV